MADPTAPVEPERLAAQLPAGRAEGQDKASTVLNSSKESTTLSSFSFHISSFEFGDAGSPKSHCSPWEPKETIDETITGMITKTHFHLNGRK